MVTFSTIFFPPETIAKFLPGPLALIAAANPLSLAAQTLRESALGAKPLDPSMLTGLLLASLPFALMGLIAYWVILKTIRLRGKP